MGFIGKTLGGLLGSAIGGIAGAGQPDPHFERSGLSQAGQLAQQGMSDRANRSEQDWAGKAQEGTGQAGQGLLGTEAQSQAQNTALGSANGDELSKAIAKKGARSFSSDMSQLGRQAQAQGISQKMQAQNEKIAAEQKQQQIEQEINQQQKDAETEQQANQNKVISNVIGGATSGAIQGISFLNEAATKRKQQTIRGQQAAANYFGKGR